MGFCAGRGRAEVASGLVGGDFRGAQDQIFQGFDEDGGVAYGGHHAVEGDAVFFCVGAALNIDFVKGFDVFGDEGDGDDEHFFNAFVPETLEGGNERWFEPFGGANSALVTEEMDAGPVWKFAGALFTDQANGFGYLRGIGIALFHETHRQAVGAEDQMDARTVWKLTQDFADVVYECLDIERVIIEMFDGAFGEGEVWFAVDAAPFFQAAECGGVGVVGVEREEDKFIEIFGGANFGDSIGGQWMPVAHGSDSYGIDVGRDGFDQFCALAFGEDGDGGAAANLGVATGDGDGAFARDVTGQGVADEI